MQPIHLEAPVGFRRLTLIVALLLLGLELAVFWYAARLTSLLAPRQPSDADLGIFIAFWSLLTLQAMVVAGFAWTVVALSRTVLDGDGVRVSLSHPWRRWSGPWTEVAEAYVSRGWLHVRARGRWRAWHVKIDGASEALAAELRSRVPAAAWLTPGQARTVLLKRLLPPVLMGAAVGGAAILLLDLWVTRALGR